ncbi:MAG: alpha/beta fold hydrolase [Acidobacteriota bacterium]|jgi:dipeptidyl aminopeptidase/acylaminoacyl peptidase
MRRFLIVFIAFCATITWLVPAQQPAANQPGAFTLTVDSIMRGPKLIGSAPTAVRWAPDSSRIYFSWQKPGEDRAQTYSVNKDGSDLRQLTAEEVRQIPAAPTGRYDRTKKRLLTAENGNIVIYDVATNARRELMRTASIESNPRWVRNDTAVTFMRDGNLFLMSLDASVNSPTEIQLTDVVAPAGETATAPAAAGPRGAAGATGTRGGGQGGAQGARGGGSAAATTDSQRVLQQEEMNLIEYLKRQAELRQQGGRGGSIGGGRGGGRGGAAGPAGAPAVPIARFQPSPRQTVTDMQLSTDENFVFIGVTERPEIPARNQDVPNYVTESSYPEIINGRSDVGDSQTRRLLAILDLKQNKTVWADATAFAGNERPMKQGDAPVPRILDWGMPDWSDDGSHAVFTVRSADNKDRWYVTVDPATGKATVLDNLHDDAWIREMSISTGIGGGGGFGGGGGAGGGIAWLPDNKRFLFLSEKDGWMHLYSMDVSADHPAAKQLTSGKWEIDNARLSSDRTRIFFTANEVHPGERHFYSISVDGGLFTRFTSMTGSNEATVSPDEKSLAIIYSYSTKPPELYVMPFTAGAQSKQLTTTPTEEWRSFKWIDPKVITYKARDGVDVYARLFTPEMIGAKRDPHHPAVVFIHGAGYLQNAHKYWPSSYYHEYMFNNLLAARGYVILDPDYRASSGYGRDWRAAIYEHMGGKDLDDIVDGAKFLVATEKVDPKRIGVYGGSYGGFLTLMAMFTTPDVFAAGAALRPVTDWSHYNHGYTAPILNLPQNDLDAYKRSSPIYFADGLKGQLLICHGMVDTNVFFQDTVRLIQRLIELRKETWSVAPFPIENHSFTEETSWADEYKRILKLFEDNLRR